MARSDRRTQLLLIAGFAAVVVAALIVVSALGGGESDDSGSEAASLDGIPQQGTVLGDPDAPATLTEFADLQCPFCGQFANDALPALIDDYVRPGDLRLDFAGLTFVGPDSETAARMAAAASLQDRMWQFIEAFYADQGTENSGYVTEEFLRDVGEAAGLDVDRALADADSAEVDRILDRAAALAGRVGVESTPSFALSRGSQAPTELLQADSLDAGVLDADIDAFLGQG